MSNKYWRNIIVKGDYHAQFQGLKEFLQDNQTTRDDLLICLGDVGVNYNLDFHDEERKKFLSKLPITFLMLRGNHETRPENVLAMQKIYDERFQCEVYTEPQYPNIYYINCGEFYLNDMRCLAISGAYSVDKPYRLMMGWNWFPDEQPTEDEKDMVRETVNENPVFDYVFSHTAPLSKEPTHLFLSNINQSKVDKSTENFLEEIYQTIDRGALKLWYIGHYHADEWLGGGVRMLYHDYDFILNAGENK